MAVNIETILAARNLIGMIQSVVSGVPGDLMPEGFYRPTRSCEGNRGSYFKIRGTRQTARIVQYGGPSKARELAGISEEPITLLHAFEHEVYSPALLQNLVAENQNSPDAEVKQRLGLQTISRQISMFGDLFKNLRISAIYSVFGTGAVAWDRDGNLLPPSLQSGAAYCVNFGVPAGNTGQLDVFGSGDILDASWDASTTHILRQLKQVKKAARKLTGYPLKYAFYGENIPGYLASNAEFQQMIHGSSRLAESMAENEIPKGLGGFEWYPISEAFFAAASTPPTSQGADETSSYADWFGPDQVVFTPDPSPDWWEVLEGTYPVPRAFTITKNAMQQVQSLQQMAGAFTYCVLIDDPVTIKHLAGDTFLPVLKVPAAVFQATVKF